VQADRLVAFPLTPLLPPFCTGPDLGGICDGVDLNRNYDDHWGMGPLCSAALQCLPTYRGEGPASEPEVRATQDYMAEIATRHTVLGALDCKPKLRLSSGTVLLLALLPLLCKSLFAESKAPADGPRRDRRQGTPTPS